MKGKGRVVDTSSSDRADWGDNISCNSLTVVVEATPSKCVSKGAVKEVSNRSSSNCSRSSINDVVLETKKGKQTFASYEEFVRTSMKELGVETNDGGGTLERSSSPRELSILPRELSRLKTDLTSSTMPVMNLSTIEDSSNRSAVCNAASSSSAINSDEKKGSFSKVSTHLKDDEASTPSESIDVPSGATTTNTSSIMPKPCDEEPPKIFEYTKPDSSHSNDYTSNSPIKNIDTPIPIENKSDPFGHNISGCYDAFLAEVSACSKEPHTNLESTEPGISHSKDHTFLPIQNMDDPKPTENNSDTLATPYHNTMTQGEESTYGNSDNGCNTWDDEESNLLDSNQSPNNDKNISECQNLSEDGDNLTAAAPTSTALPSSDLDDAVSHDQHSISRRLKVKICKKLGPWIILSVTVAVIVGLLVGSSQSEPMAITAVPLQNPSQAPSTPPTQKRAPIIKSAAPSNDPSTPPPLSTSPTTQAPTSQPSLSTTPTISAAPIIKTAAPSNDPSTPPTLSTSPTTQAPTSQPSLSTTPTISAQPTTEIASTLASQIKTSYLVDTELLGNDSDPYGKAFEWMSNDPLVVSSMSNARIGYTSDAIDQRFCLALFYFQMMGETWTNCSHIAPHPNCTVLIRDHIALPDRKLWLSESNECEWGGIVCDKDNTGVVVGIYLNELGLKGSIPKEITKLTKLRELYLMNNNIEGHIPTEIGTLSKLVAIDFRNNSLSHTIPMELYSLIDLKDLTLGYNRLSGTIASHIGNLKSLKVLYVAENTLTGSIPSEIGLMNLDVLTISKNKFSDSLPTEFNRLTKLHTLYMNYNDFTGELQLPIAPRLTQLPVNNNRFNGTLPDNLYKLTNLHYLDASNNEFTGKVKPAIGNLTLLQVIKFRKNSLQGTIPEEIEKLKHLDILQLTYNNFQGEVSNGICDLDIKTFDTDCGKGRGVEGRAKVFCACCTTCCDPTGICYIVE